MVMTDAKHVAASCTRGAARANWPIRIEQYFTV